MLHDAPSIRSIFAILCLTSLVFPACNIRDTAIDQSGSWDLDTPSDMNPPRDQSLPPEDLAAELDQDEMMPDSGLPPQDMSTGIDQGCVRPSDLELCRRAQAQCDAFTVEDECGELRDVDCGACVGGAECANNQCPVCVGERDAELCMTQNFMCGSALITDRCGDERVVDCEDTCEENANCVDNQCECTPDTSAVLCTREGTQCGAISVDNGCGEVVDVECDLCTGGCRPDGTCPGDCEPVDPMVLCSSQGLECGTHMLQNNCGVQISVDCGGCNGDSICNTSAQCECPQPSCAGIACGVATNDCGYVTMCPSSCDQATEQCVDNQCECTILQCPANFECGAVDACGTALTCGSCLGNTFCNANMCSTLSGQSPMGVPSPVGQDVSMAGDWYAASGFAPASRDGYVYLFQRDPLTKSWVEQERIVIPVNIEFGYSIALSENADFIAVGVPGVGGDAGQVNIYRQNAPDDWVLEALISPPSTGEGRFGHSVAVYNNLLVVGAPLATMGRGRAYVYQRTGRTWGAPQELAPTGLDADANFGHAVDIHNDRLAVGAPLQGASNIGAIYEYERVGSNWTLDLGPLFPPSLGSNAHYGHAVSVSDAYVVASSPNHSDGVTSSGEKLGLIHVRNYVTGVDTTLLNTSSWGRNILGWDLHVEGDTIIASSHVASDFTTFPMSQHGARFFKFEQGTWTRKPGLNTASNNQFGFSVSGDVSQNLAIFGAPGAPKVDITHARQF